MEKFLLENFIYIFARQYIDFKNRANVKQFWSFILVSVVLYALIPSLVFIISLIADKDDFASRLSAYICAAVLFPPFLAITSRRLRDAGHSAYWQFLFYAPCFLFAILFLFLLAVISEVPDLEMLSENTLASVFAISCIISALLAILGAIVLIIFLLLPSKNKAIHNS